MPHTPKTRSPRLPPLSTAEEEAQSQTNQGEDFPSILSEDPELHLESLGERFMQALDLIRNAQIEEAREALREILATEPRLPEPRIELARIFLQEGDLEQAEAQARISLELLEKGGRWNLDISMASMMGLAHGLLAEAIRQKSESDAIVMHDPQQIWELTRQAYHHFKRAADLDPDNEHARYYAFHLGLEISQPVH